MYEACEENIICDPEHKFQIILLLNDHHIQFHMH